MVLKISYEKENKMIDRTVNVPLQPTAESVRAAFAVRGARVSDLQVSGILNAVQRFDGAIGRLKTAGDHVLEDFQGRQAHLQGEQREAFERVLGNVIEHADALMLVRTSVLAGVLEPSDSDVHALLASAGAVSGQVLQAVAQN